MIRGAVWGAGSILLSTLWSQAPSQESEMESKEKKLAGKQTEGVEGHKAGEAWSIKRTLENDPH